MKLAGGVGDPRAGTADVTISSAVVVVISAEVTDVTEVVGVATGIVGTVLIWVGPLQLDVASCSTSRCGRPGVPEFTSWVEEFADCAWNVLFEQQKLLIECPHNYWKWLLG